MEQKLMLSFVQWNKEDHIKQERIQNGNESHEI